MVEIGNVTAALRSILLGLGVSVSSQIPNPRPVAFIVLSAAGGSQLSMVSRRRVYMVDVWAASKFEAEELAMRVQRRLESVVNEVSDGVLVSSVSSVTDITDVPDPDTGLPRARQTVQVNVRAI